MRFRRKKKEFKLMYYDNNYLCWKDLHTNAMTRDECEREKATMNVLHPTYRYRIVKV